MRSTWNCFASHNWWQRDPGDVVAGYRATPLLGIDDFVKFVVELRSGPLAVALNRGGASTIVNAMVIRMIRSRILARPMTLTWSRTYY